MASVVSKLESAGLIKPPKFVVPNVQYETLMGSVAYGVSSDTSDCWPLKPRREWPFG